MTGLLTPAWALTLGADRQVFWLWAVTLGPAWVDARRVLVADLGGQLLQIDPPRDPVRAMLDHSE